MQEVTNLCSEIVGGWVFQPGPRLNRPLQECSTPSLSWKVRVSFAASAQRVKYVIVVLYSPMFELNHEANSFDLGEMAPPTPRPLAPRPLAPSPLGPSPLAPRPL